MGETFSSAEEFVRHVKSGDSFECYSPVLQGLIHVEDVGTGRELVKGVQGESSVFTDEEGEPMMELVDEARVVFRAQEERPTDTDGDTGKWIMAVYGSGLVQAYWCDESWRPVGGHHELRVGAFEQ